ncbi:MAG: hypothetical protein HND51_04655 [Chloroflexi bacterium]|nr:hypothetical protein [Chloroflexota bacterium]
MRLNYAGGSSLYEEATAFVREGQPIVEELAPQAPQSPSIAEIIPAEDVQIEDSPSPNRLWLWITISLTVLALSLLAIIIVRRRRMKSRIIANPQN